VKPRRCGVACATPELLFDTRSFLTRRVVSSTIPYRCNPHRVQIVQIILRTQVRRPRFLIAVLVAATLGLLSLPLIPSSAHAATATFKQANAKEIKSGGDNNVAFKNANTAGNFIVVFLAWTNTSSVSVTDSHKNEYKKVADPTPWGSNRSSQVFYASNIAGGSNTVQAKFTTAIKSPGWAAMYIQEYSAIDNANPVDVSHVNTGMTAEMSSGSATTTNANDLIFGAGASSGKMTQVGAGFTLRSDAFDNRTEDMNVTTVGPYEATATQDGNSNPWVMHLVAFRVDPNAPDTTAPSTPTGLTQTSTGMNQVELTWNGSSDNTEVTGYEVLRNNAVIAAPKTTSFTDSNLQPLTTYTYTVRARDAAGNLSAKSAAITATTPSPPVDTTLPIVSITAPITNAIVSGAIDVTATATDDVGVASVQVLVDGSPIGNPDTTSPYSVSWDTSNASDGDHELTARARDAANNVGMSAPVKVTVDKTAPTVTITAPLGNTDVADMVNVTAEASDNVAVAAVEFQVDQVDRQTRTTRPYVMAWDSRTVPNGSHTITARTRDTAGNIKLSTPVTVNVANDYSQCGVTVGSGPTASILEPNPARTVSAGDEVLLRAEATDPNCGPLQDNAFDWNIKLVDDVRSIDLPPITGVKNAAFTVPAQSSPDLRGFGVNTRYHITLFATNRQGQKASSSVDIFLKKVQLTFDTAPAGLTLYIDSIARPTPFNLETIVGSTVNIDARPQTKGGSPYTFASWSDNKIQKHDIVAPASPTTYTATYALSPPATTSIAFKQQNYSTSEISQRTVSVTYTEAQTAGDTNVLAIGWPSDQGTITTISDEAGNSYVPVDIPNPAGAKLKQAIYYATNIKGFRARNTVQVTFSSDVMGVNVRSAEYSGIAEKDTVDAKSTNSGSNNSATASVTTIAANTVVFVAGISLSTFGEATPNEFITRRITVPKMGGFSGTGIVADRVVDATGTYPVTVPVTGGGAWLLQMVAFKGTAS
jgi:chitodextrinase